MEQIVFNFIDNLAYILMVYSGFGILFVIFLNWSLINAFKSGHHGKTPIQFAKIVMNNPSEFLEKDVIALSVYHQNMDKGVVVILIFLISSTWVFSI